MIGFSPKEDDLVLTLGADFTHVIQPPPDYAFQPGTTVRIDIFKNKDDTTPVDSWDAEVTSTAAKWVIQSDVADLIPNRYRFRLYISYPDLPTTDYCWYVGSILRTQ